MFADPDLLYFANIIFKNITVSLEKATLQKKMLQLRKNQIALMQMTLGTQKLHLELCSSMKNVGISQESKMVENLLKILAKKCRRFTISYKCPFSDKCCGREYFSSNLWNIYCEMIFLVIFYYRVNVKDRICFSDQMNRSL